jgi:hypothetical protein
VRHALPAALKPKVTLLVTRSTHASHPWRPRALVCGGGASVIPLHSDLMRLLMRAALPVALPSYGIRTTLEFSQAAVHVRSSCFAGDAR